MNKTTYLWFILSGLMGMSAVIAGAVAAHGGLDDAGQFLVEKAVDYQFWHTLALLAVALLSKENSRLVTAAGALFSIGILCFCGALYMNGFLGLPLFPMAAPTGGICFILGWGCFVLYGVKRFPQQAQ